LLQKVFFQQSVKNFVIQKIDVVHLFIYLFLIGGDFRPKIPFARRYKRNAETAQNKKVTRNKNITQTRQVQYFNRLYVE